MQAITAMATAMDMGSMRSIESPVGFYFEMKSYITIMAFFLFPLSIFAKNITVVPTLSLQETYSDNINLSSIGPKKGAFVTSISPGVFISGNTAKHRFNLNYQMQNLYNAGGNGGINIFNQLQFNSHSILVNNKLFLDARGGISQQNINNNRIVADNLSGGSNRTNVTTFGLSPYWSPSFGNYASGLFRINFDVIKTDANLQNSLSNKNLTPLSDSINVAQIVNLNSGPEFQRINWSIAFNNNESYRSDGQDVKFQNFNALIRTYINKYFNVFAATGYSDNTFATTTNTTKNGWYYTFGGKWMPSQHYSIEAGYGNNAYVTVFISPIQRFNWITTYRNNSIGLNSGSTWQTSLRYNTRNSNWSVTRINDTTTVQSYLSQLSIFPGQYSLNGNINQPNLLNGVANNNLPNQFNINGPNYTNEVIVSTTWNFSASYTTGKSNFLLSYYDQDRVYQFSRTHERVRGVSGLWNWQFARKTSAYLTPLWQEAVRDNAGKDNRYSVAIGVNRQISTLINSRIEFSHVNQTSDLISNNYTENRATLSLFMRF